MNKIIKNEKKERKEQRHIGDMKNKIKLVNDIISICADMSHV